VAKLRFTFAEAQVDGEGVCFFTFDESILNFSWKNFTAHAFFVIDDGGNELQIIVTDPGTVINCIARRLFPKREEPDRDDSRE
jgi:hypothetical protein